MLDTDTTSTDKIHEFHEIKVVGDVVVLLLKRKFERFNWLKRKRVVGNEGETEK